MESDKKNTVTQLTLDLRLNPIRPRGLEYEIEEGFIIRDCHWIVLISSEFHIGLLFSSSHSIYLLSYFFLWRKLIRKLRTFRLKLYLGVYNYSVLKNAFSNQWK